MSLLELCAAVVAVTLGVLAVAKIVDGSTVGSWRDRLPQARLWQVLVGIGALALLFATAEKPGFLVLLLSGVVLVLFARAWVAEFLFLMGLRDDVLPGRFDKVVWAGLLVALPPVGLWVFRRYRAEHWPESVEAKRRHGAFGEVL
jgi:hypothetical protein